MQLHLLSAVIILHVVKILVDVQYVKLEHYCCEGYVNFSLLILFSLLVGSCRVSTAFYWYIHVHVQYFM